MVIEEKGLEETPVEPEANPEEAKPSIEELQAQLAALSETSTQLEGKLKQEQRTTGGQSTTIQRLREQLEGNESQSDMVKALVAMMASQKNQPTEEFTEEVKAQQPDLLKQYEKIVAASDKKRQLDRVTNRIKTVQERTDALGLQGEDYDIVRAFAEAGQFDKAEARLDKLAEVKQTKPPEPKEGEDERVERLATERLKAELEKRGLLTQDTGGPSASATKRADVLAKVASGEMSTEDAEKAGFTFS